MCHFPNDQLPLLDRQFEGDVQSQLDWEYDPVLRKKPDDDGVLAVIASNI
ncbi:hypothetical protein CKA32_002701 [Geitlerinema sp. FC II]|nr:hypothetical protein CKA32_002701 [Geitlerinema sp. FC II]